MTAHDHRTFVEGCYRCDLGKDEAARALREDVADLLADEWPSHIQWHEWDRRRAITAHMIDTLHSNGYAVIQTDAIDSQDGEP